MGRKTILEIVQAATEELAFDSPSVVLSSTDATVRQLKALTIAACDELVDTYDWQQLLKEHTFTTTAGTSLYDLPADLSRIEGNTLWNRSTRLPLHGNEHAQNWQALESGIGVTGPHQRFRIVLDQLELMPEPAAEEVIAYNYYSAHYVVNGTTGAKQAAFTQDSDKTVFHDRLLINFIKLKLLQEKGLDTTVAAANFNASLQSVLGFNVPSPTLRLGRAGTGTLLSGRNVGDGNWG